MPTGIKKLEDRLLGIGGDRMDIPPEWLQSPDSVAGIQNLLVRGRLFEGTPEHEVMDANQCHKNATTLFLEGRVHSFATGTRHSRSTSALNIAAKPA